MSNPSHPIAPNPNFSVAYGQQASIQPQWQISEDGRGLLEGTLEIKQKTDALYPNWNYGVIPKKGNNHPWESRLKCYKTSTQFSSQGTMSITANYIGLLQDPTYSETETSGTTSGANVQLHPNFPAMAFKVPPSDSNPDPSWMPYVDTQNKEGINFEKFNALTAPSGLKGVESYYAPKATVRVTFYTAQMSIANKMLDNIGCIADKPYLANGPLPTGGNFLLTSASISTYGTVYKITSEWMMCEQGVLWSTDLYRAFGSGGRTSNLWKYEFNTDAYKKASGTSNW
jgi:hypothetical protein